MKKIELTPTEFLQAALIGMLRLLKNKLRGRFNSYGSENNPDRWGDHIEGACGEMAVAKFFNVFWSGNMDDFLAVDVNIERFLIEVRTVDVEKKRLRLHPKDDDNRVCILVMGKAPKFKIKGWILAKDGKQDKYWEDPGTGRPAFFVPQSELKSIEELKR